MNRLAKAAELVAKKPGEALLLLLEVWRETRSEKLATIIDRVEQLHPRRPLGSGSLKAQTARWNEIAAARDPLDLPRLVAGLAGGRAQSAALRMEVLLEFPDDPRIAKPLAQFIAVPPYSSGTAMDLAVKRCRELLVRIADARVIPILHAHPALADQIDARAKSAVALDATALAKLDALFGDAKSGDDLLAAIYANPADDAPRMIYADWLLEQGDMRGEWIHLQLAKAHAPLSSEQLAREEVLFGKLGEKLLPVAMNRVTAGAREFRRGFVYRVTLAPKNQRTMITASTLPEWQTVEHVVCEGGYGFAAPDLFAGEMFRNVRHVTNAGATTVRGLAAMTEHRIETLGIGAVYGDEARRAILPDVIKITSLVTLQLGHLSIDELPSIIEIVDKIPKLTFDIVGVDFEPYRAALQSSGFLEIDLGYTARRETWKRSRPDERF